MLKPLKTIEKKRFGCGFEGHLAGHGRHLLANKAAKSQHDPFLGLSSAHLGPMSKQLGPRVLLRLFSCVDVARSFWKTLIFPSAFGVEVGFVR